MNARMMSNASRRARRTLARFGRALRVTALGLSLVVAAPTWSEEEPTDPPETDPPAPALETAPEPTAVDAEAADDAADQAAAAPASTPEPAAAPAITPASPPSPAPRLARPPSTGSRSDRPSPGGTPGKPASPGDPQGVRLNFQNAALSDVLNYLSEAAGFVIVQEATVSGTVNVLSHQPLTPDDTVDLLNTVLAEKGYTAIRNGRILKIVARKDAAKRDLPVRTARTADQIPKNDEMVTQIIQVRFAEAMKIVENLRPLLPETASLTANESSNALVLTDTQANVRRMVEIIQALDTSIAGISTIRVFPLRYADALQLAEVVKELFATTSTTGRSTGGRGGGMAAMMERFRMGGPGGGPGSGSTATGNSEARQAASRVVAVGDDRTNSLIVSAPDDLMPTVEQLVQEIDTNIADVTEVRIFRLENADASELADVVYQVFSPDETTTSTSGRSGQNRFQPPWMQQGNRGNSNQTGQRTLLQTRVVAIGDPRTNSLIISAAREMMTQIAEMVGRLDASNDRKQRVHVVPLEHADVENVATVLRGMFENQTGTTARNRNRSTSQTTSRLNQRSTAGASTDTSLNNMGGRGGTGR